MQWFIIAKLESTHSEVFIIIFFLTTLGKNLANTPVGIHARQNLLFKSLFTFALEKRGI